MSTCSSLSWEILLRQRMSYSIWTVEERKPRRRRKRSRGYGSRQIRSEEKNNLLRCKQPIHLPCGRTQLKAGPLGSNKTFLIPFPAYLHQCTTTKTLYRISRIKVSLGRSSQDIQPRAKSRINNNIANLPCLCVLKSLADNL